MPALRDEDKVNNSGAKQAAITGICVLNWNSGRALVECLETLHFEQSTSSIRIVVVDNASTDDSIEMLRRRFPAIPVVINASNRGYAAGNNVGAAHLLASGCELLVFINPDVTLPRRSLDALTSTLLRNLGAGCAGGIPVSRKKSLAARTRPSALGKLVFYGPLHRIGLIGRLCAGHILDPDDLEDGSEVYAVCGACIAFRAEAFRDAMGFDENTFLYEEEFIIAERLMASGWSTVLAKEARYGHIEGLSTDQIPYRRRMHFIASEQYFLRKYCRWGRFSLSVLKAIRCLEWCLYALRWSVTHG